MARILVVEDEFIPAFHLENLLKNRGHTVSAVARSGEQAIEHAREQPPDIVLMDLRLAEKLDGVDAAREIVAERQCGLIFITAHNDSENVARMNLLKPDAIITKPALDNAVLDAVARTVKRLAKANKA